MYIENTEIINNNFSNKFINFSWLIDGKNV